MDIKKLTHRCKAKKTRVVAKLTTTTGIVSVGVNVESSSHSLSVCAERAAIIVAVCSLGPTFKIESMEIYAEREGKDIDIVPCGACRQLISEYAYEGTTVQGKLMDYWMPNPYL